MSYIYREHRMLRKLIWEHHSQTTLKNKNKIKKPENCASLARFIASSLRLRQWVHSREREHEISCRTNSSFCHFYFNFLFPEPHRLLSDDATSVSSTGKREKKRKERGKAAKRKSPLNEELFHFISVPPTFQGSILLCTVFIPTADGSLMHFIFIFYYPDSRLVSYVRFLSLRQMEVLIPFNYY